MSNTPSSPAFAGASELAGSEVAFSTADGSWRARVSRVNRHAAVFELFNPAFTLKKSDAFDKCAIILQGETVYAGRAVVRNVVSDGLTLTCEITLDESAWQLSGGLDAESVRTGFAAVMREWQKNHLIGHDYKIVIADLQTFMGDLKLWLDKIELQIHSAPAADRPQLENDCMQTLAGPLLGAMDGLFERFEEVAEKIAPDRLPAHRAYGQRMLHPFLLSSPFLFRTYSKPLGYAGDYEMMNMIVRNHMLGGTLFAKFVDAFLLAQPAPQAVRNRVHFLYERIVAETGRAVREGRRAKILSVACGPAWETMNFIANHPLSDHADFELLDFETETLQHAVKNAETARRRNGSRATVEVTKNSVQNLMREGTRGGGREEQFDLVYCSGLYDYLNDQICRNVNDCFFRFLRPGGLMAVGNFSHDTPHQSIMEHFAEWFLIYRSSRELAALAPVDPAVEDSAVRAEPTGTNLFLEVRKKSRA